MTNAAVEYQKPVLYLGDSEICLRQSDGRWACLFREPYQVLYFNDVAEALRYKYGSGVVSVIVLDICVLLENGEGYCHSDKP